MQGLADRLEPADQVPDRIDVDTALELGDLSADRLQPLGEALDTFGAGEPRDHLANLVEFAMDAIECAAVGMAHDGGERAVGTAHQPLGLASQTSMDVVGELFRQALDLLAHHGDRRGEFGRLAGPLHVGGERAHGLLQRADVAACGQAAERFAQAGGLGLQFGDGR